MEAALTFNDFPFLKELGLEETNKGCYRNGEWVSGEKAFTSKNPNNNKPVANTLLATEAQYEECIQGMLSEQARWAMTPMPARGEIVREIGLALREKKEALGSLVSLEMGKVKSEGNGEVQEFIDICDMACGLSRSIAGQVVQSERPGHFMMENWTPLGLIGVITAFNFPCAVAGWNTAIALVSGDLMVWKGASTTSLVTLAVGKVIVDTLKKHGFNNVLTICQGSGATIGERIINDARLKLISFTGSTEIGQRISEVVHRRFGRTILELGGNNAAIVMADANLDLALKACTFSAVGTAGQRCTTLRRIFIQDSVYDKFVERLVKAYKSVSIGDSLQEGILMGPLHTPSAVKEYTDGLETIQAQGGKILTGGKPVEGKEGNFVEPTLVEINHDADIVKTELFVPICYVMKFSTIEEAIAWNNEVPQGLSSSLFTTTLENYMKWVGPCGSDCGIVNCNVGPSGAEIGGAFGGEKETGGGREAGSDSWKQYMKRSTCTLNFTSNLPLAQGVKFDVE